MSLASSRSSSSLESWSRRSSCRRRRRQQQQQQQRLSDDREAQQPHQSDRPSTSGRHKILGSLLTAGLALATEVAFATSFALAEPLPSSLPIIASSLLQQQHQQQQHIEPTITNHQSEATPHRQQPVHHDQQRDGRDERLRISSPIIDPTVPRPLHINQEAQQQADTTTNQFHTDHHQATSFQQHKTSQPSPISNNNQAPTQSFSSSSLSSSFSISAISKALALRATRSDEPEIDFNQATTTTAAMQDNNLQLLQDQAGSITSSNMNNQLQEVADNSWQDFWSSKPFPSGYTQSNIIFLACLIGTIILLIVVGNLLVCIAIFTEKSLKPTQNRFIAALAVSDMMLGLIVMPFSLARELMGFWMFGRLWCDIHEAVDVLLTTASINTLCLISLDRYLSITKAVSYLNWRTPLRAALMIAFVWVLSAGVSLPPLFLGERQNSPIIVPHPIHPPSKQLYNNSIVSMQKGNTNDRTLAKRSQSFASPSNQLSTPVLTLQSQLNRMQDYVNRQNQETSNNYFVLESSDYVDGSPVDNNQDQPSASMSTTSLTKELATTTTSAITNGNNQQQYYTEYPTCQLSDNLWYVLYSATMSFFGPCIVMVFVYAKIYIAARSRARRTIVAKPSRSKKAADASAANRRHLTAVTAAAMAISNNKSAPLTTTTTTTTSSNGGAANDVAGNGTARRFTPKSSPLPADHPLMKGKIVIVERRKSIAASSLAPLNPDVDDGDDDGNQDGDQENGYQQQQHQQKRAMAVVNTISSDETNLAKGLQTTTTTTTICTLTTSGAHPAKSLADLAADHPKPDINKKIESATSNVNVDNIDEAKDLHSDSVSSIVTVMKPSMPEVPVTRFNFQKNETELLASQSRAEEEKRNAHALLNAITSLAASSKSSLASACDSKPVAGPDDDPILSEILNDVADEQRKPGIGPTGRDAIGNEKSIRCDFDAEAGFVGPSTKETCFMTMDEEDSEMVDAQTGRTILMMAAAATTNHSTHGHCHHHTNNNNKKMSLSGNECLNAACRRALHNQRQHRGGGLRAGAAANSTAAVAAAARSSSGGDVGTGNRSGSSYCNSLDEASDVQADNLYHAHQHQHHTGCNHAIEGDHLDLDDQDDDGLLLSDGADDECNGYSISCPLEDEADSCSRCHECGLVDDDGTSNNSTYAENCHRNASSSISVDSPCHWKPTPTRHRTTTTTRRDNNICQQHSAQQSKMLTGSGDNRMIDLEAQLATSKNGKQRGRRRHHSRGHSKQEVSDSNNEDNYYEDDDDASIDDVEDDEVSEMDDDEEDDLDEDEVDEDEESSVIGHDMLDATAGPMRSVPKGLASSKRKSIPSDVGKQQAADFKPLNQQQQVHRKRSIIGIRLPSLGGVGGSISGSSQQQKTKSGLADERSMHDVKSDNSAADKSHQQQYGDVITKPMPPTTTTTSTTATLALSTITTTATPPAVPLVSAPSGGTRNLKALRQTFFLKLNQLTAKSKSHDMHKNQKLLSASSSDKPSLSYEPSTSCAGDYPMETTVVDDYEPQTSGENQNSGHTIEMEGPSSQQQAANSSDQTFDEMNDNSRAGAAAGNGRNVVGDNQMHVQQATSDQHRTGNQQMNNSANKQRLGGTKSMIVSSSMMTENSSIGGFDDVDQINANNKRNIYQQQKGAAGFKKIVKIQGSNFGRSSGMANSSVGTGPTTKRAHLPADTERHKRKLAKARERRATMILGLVMFCFIAAWCPFFIYYVVRAVCVACRDYVSPRVEAVIFWAGYCNSAINPIIYTIFNRDFRKAFRKILFRCI